MSFTSFIQSSLLFNPAIPASCAREFVPRSFITLERIFLINSGDAITDPILRPAIPNIFEKL